MLLRENASQLYGIMGDFAAPIGEVSGEENAFSFVSEEYEIKTVMTFGGEPLLYADAVYEIMRAALRMNIPKRQVITNGYFSKFLVS